MRWLAIVGLTALALALLGVRADRRAEQDQRARPLAELPEDLAGQDGFASASRCRACHPSQYDSWWGSYHRKMTEPAVPESVVGDFSGQALEWAGRRYRMLRVEGVPHVEMPAFGTTGARPEDRWRLPVVMVTGSHHLQAYWVKPPMSPAPAGGYDAWKAVCASCHEEDDAPLLDDQGYLSSSLRTAFDAAHAVVERPIEPKENEEGEVVLRLFEGARLPVEVDDRGQAELALAFIDRSQFNGRLIQFPFVYLISEDRWVHEEQSFLQPSPEESETLEPIGDRWSYACDGCHSTGPTYRRDARTREVESGAVDLGIGCESCHGPAAAHAERFQDPFARWTARGSDDVVNPSKLSPARASMVCGNCHANLEEKRGVKGRFMPGDDLTERAHVIQVPAPGEVPDEWLQLLLEDDPDTFSGTYWKDGTIRVAGRDYNGLMRSPCATKGELSCLSCHQMHGAPPDDQLKAGAREDAVCRSCHDGLDPAAHSRHPAGSEGARCMNCHMPYTTYGLFKAIRSHRVDSPTVEMSARFDRPNACNLCHLDKSLAWTARQLHEGWGQPARADLEDDRPAGLTWLVRGDGVQRALLAWHLRWSPALEASGGAEAFAPALLSAFDDRYAAVRYQAAVSLRGLGVEGLDFAAEDEVRARQLEAARARWLEAKPGAKTSFAEVSALRAGRPDPDVAIDE